MSVLNRRAILGLAQGALAAVAVGAISVHLIESAEAIPISTQSSGAEKSPSRMTLAQWGPPPHPGWGRSPPRRHRRWVCWWHRGRRICRWR